MRVLLLAAIAVGHATAGSFVYTDFSSLDGLTLNGDAAPAGTALRLVPSSEDRSGTAYRTTAVPLTPTTGFSTSFEFLVKTDPLSGFGVPDGFTFLLQNSDVNALGAGGQGLGYVGINPSVAVVFRGRDPSFIGVITGGVDPADPSINFEPPGYTGMTEGDFYEVNQFAWIDYDPTSFVLSVYLDLNPVKPASPVMSTAVDIFNTLGSEAFVGFSAGNGSAYGSQDILNWSFTTVTVPEPAAGAGIIACGLVTFGLTRRPRRC